MLYLSRLLPLLALLLFPAALQAQVVVEDEGVTISRPELEQLLKRWTPQMLQSAADDEGDRLELLNSALVSKKLAREVDKLSLEQDPEAYWEYQFMIQRVQLNFVLDQFTKTLEVPDMSELAQERYTTQKDKYALVPETRLSSHILFSCMAGTCDREPLRAKAAELLAQLRAGANFEEMVTSYSQDPGSKDNGGKFDRWMMLGEEGVEPHYTGGVFEIEKVGDYSEVVDTRFGLHIIRLDGIQEQHYLPYEQVKARIMADLEGEYRTLAKKEYFAKFRLTDNARMDGAALEELFAPYKSEPKPEPEPESSPEPAPTPDPAG